MKRYSELDFWKELLYHNLDNLKQEWQIEEQKRKQGN